MPPRPCVFLPRHVGPIALVKYSHTSLVLTRLLGIECALTKRDGLSDTTNGFATECIDQDFSPLSEMVPIRDTECFNERLARSLPTLIILYYSPRDALGMAIRRGLSTFAQEARSVRETSA